MTDLLTVSKEEIFDFLRHEKREKVGLHVYRYGEFFVKYRWGCAANEEMNPLLLQYFDIEAPAGRRVNCTRNEIHSLYQHLNQKRSCEWNAKTDALFIYPAISGKQGIRDDLQSEWPVYQEIALRKLLVPLMVSGTFDPNDPGNYLCENKEITCVDFNNSFINEMTMEEYHSTFSVFIDDNSIFHSDNYPWTDYLQQCDDITRRVETDPLPDKALKRYPTLPKKLRKNAETFKSYIHTHHLVA